MAPWQYLNSKTEINQDEKNINTQALRIPNLMNSTHLSAVQAVAVVGLDVSCNGPKGLGVYYEVD